MVEGKLVEVEDKLGGVELKLAEAASLNLAQADEIADLKRLLKLVKASGMMRASRILRDLWSLLSIRPDPTGSGRDGL